MSIQAVHPTGSFAEAYKEIASSAVKARIQRTIKAVEAFSDIGSAHPKKSLARRYGEGIRTMASGQYVIVYRHDGAQLVLLALVPGKLVL